MRSFFVQIFLSFWISSIGIFIAVTAIFPKSDYSFPENLSAGLNQAMETIANLSGSCNADLKRRQDLFVIAANGREICARKIPDEIVAVANKARLTGQRASARDGSMWVAARIIRSGPATGMTVIQLTPFHRVPWFPHFPAAALPVSALVTFVFAYALTKPVRALRAAFRQFSAGDLSVRSKAPRLKRVNWGGDDIRTLMVDFNEMADRLQALLEAHKTLLRDVSHELRSPLARLNVALELARESGGDSERALERAELESSRLNSLIGELLSLSLMESIRQVPQARDVDLGEMVEELMPDLVFEAEGRGCKVSHANSGTTVVQGNADILRRALENVIRNAIRYTPAGGAVEIQTQSMESEGRHEVAACVLDRGPGVPEDRLVAIFRPFYRVDASRQMSTGGFGVGLAIADRAVQLHGGSIHAENRLGGGLRVQMRFPVYGRFGSSVNTT